MLSASEEKFRELKLPEDRNPSPAPDVSMTKDNKVDMIQPLFDDNAQNKLDEIYLKKKEETAKKSQAMAGNSAAAPREAKLLPSFPAPNKFSTGPHETSPQPKQSSYAQLAKLNGLINNTTGPKITLEGDIAPNLGVEASPLLADYEDMLRAQENRFGALQKENDRLKGLLPDSYTEMRQKNREMAERLTSYEAKILELQNEKKEMNDRLLKKDDDIAFLNKKIQTLKDINKREVEERKKLDGIIEQQYREAMSLD